MPTYALKVKGRGEETTYSVDFPYDAYDCQVTMMERVVEALHDGEHALLESPTGRHPLDIDLKPTSLGIHRMMLTTHTARSTHRRYG